MASASVNVIGADRVSAKFTTMAARAESQEPLLEIEARRTARRITGIPVRTGRLEASVRSGGHVQGEGFVVSSDVPYARFVFGGTSKMAARPPRVPPGIAQEYARAALDWIMP